MKRSASPEVLRKDIRSFFYSSLSKLNPNGLEIRHKGSMTIDGFYYREKHHKYQKAVLVDLFNRIRVGPTDMGDEEDFNKKYGGRESFNLAKTDEDFAIFCNAKSDIFESVKVFFKDTLPKKYSHLGEINCPFHEPRLQVDGLETFSVKVIYRAKDLFDFSVYLSPPSEIEKVYFPKESIRKFFYEDIFPMYLGVTLNAKDHYKGSNDSFNFYVFEKDMVFLAKHLARMNEGLREKFTKEIVGLVCNIPQTLAVRSEGAFWRGFAGISDKLKVTDAQIEINSEKEAAAMGEYKERKEKLNAEWAQKTGQETGKGGVFSTSLTPAISPVRSPVSVDDDEGTFFSAR